MEFQKLTILHYGETTEEDRRITLSPANVAAIAAKVDDMVVNGRTLRGVTILFLDSSSMDITINHSDLEMLETAIGAFCLG